MGLLFRNLHGVLIMSFLLTILPLLFAAFRAEAVQIKILNNCSYTVWAAAIPGGGKQLNYGETWTLPDVTGSGRIWGRTNCAFDGDGHGKCESGDCDGRLQCISKGRPPNTVAQYALNQSTKHDEVRISVVEGFNIPMGFKNLTGFFCSQESRCAGDVNEACPLELRDPGGCNNPCTLFTNSQYCCTSEDVICEPTSYSKFFKDLCPTATTYPADDEYGKSTCQSGIDYDVIFCPTNSKEHYNVIGSPVNPSVNDSGATFAIFNNCPYTVWAAVLPGGGRQLNEGEFWDINVPQGTPSGRIWARTNCDFNNSGHGSCQTGDCSGVLQCKAFGQPPNTLAEYALNQYNNLDFFDISLTEGFNVPMEFSPTSGGCTRRIKCTADINGQCPSVLKAPGGCNNPCTVFNTDEYCCNSGSCEPTNYSKFFKNRCPDAYSYPKDDQTSTFTCPGGTNYKVVFCPI